MNKKGFTLIELLATIIVLAVVAIIAIPMIMGVIETARKESLKVTGKAVYEAAQKYHFNKETEGQVVICSMFEFASNRTESEEKDGITYEPISELNLKGEIPAAGYLKVCNGKIEMTIDDGENTYVKDEEKEEVLSGKMEENDKTEPEIENIKLNSSADSIIVTVDGKEEDGAVKKYYYSINGEVVESTSNIHKFTGLDKDKEYEIKVQVENGSGLKSTETTGTIKTSSIINPDIEEVSQSVTKGYTWATERVIGIVYKVEDIANPEYYLKSSVGVTVEAGIIIGICGSDVEPGECSSSSATTLEAGVWYRTNSATTNVTYRNNGTLYALTSDGQNTSGTSTYIVHKTSNDMPTAPEIIGGNTEWSSSALTISVSKESEEASGILDYQYYVSSSSEGQTDGNWLRLATGETSVLVTREGTSYTYFRAIGNNGKTGQISGYQVTYVDLTNPNITANVAGKEVTFEIRDNIGVTGYGVNDSTTTVPSFISIESTTNSNVTWTASTPGDYVAWVIDASGRTSNISFTISE